MTIINIIILKIIINCIINGLYDALVDYRLTEFYKILEEDDKMTIQDDLKTLSDFINEHYYFHMEKEKEALTRLEAALEMVDVEALKNNCLSEIEIGGMKPQKTSLFDDHMRLTIDYLASKNQLRRRG